VYLPYSAAYASVTLAESAHAPQTDPVTDDAILFRRTLPHGPAVRVRRTSATGVRPVTAVLEVDRRAGTPREHLGGFPPPLMTAEGATEDEVLSALRGQALDDRLVAGLMQRKGLR
jgi:hypothetical protein